MINIKVGGKPLYIPKETTLVLEQHNNSFDIDNITSDIIWTFDIPAKPNAATLDFAHYINISNHKLYRCEVSFQGIVIAEGNLYVQSVQDEKTISCGVALDGLGEDFGSRLLKDNDYGEDVVISQPTATLEQHRANWLQFLYGSLDANSRYKFFLFTSEKFYTNNEDYGYHRNKWSTLSTSHDKEHRWAKYINRLFTRREDGQVIIRNTSDAADDGFKLFNTLGNVSDKLNGYAFAPAIRLDWLVRKVFANAGYGVTGDFLLNDHIKKLYLQSMNAMDGDLSQFGLDEFLYITNAVGVDGVKTAMSMDVGINEVSFEGFKCNSNVPTFNFRLKADVDGLDTGGTYTPTAWQPWTYQDEVFMLLIRTPNAVAAGDYPRFRSVINHNATTRDYIYAKDRHVMGATGIYDDYFVFHQNNVLEYYDEDNTRWDTTDILQADSRLYAIQLTPSKGDTTASYPDPEQAVDILGDYPANRLRQQNGGQNYIVELAKFRIYTVQHGAWDGDYHSVDKDIWIPIWATNDGQVKHGRIEYYGNYERIEWLETVAKTELANTNTMMNVFDTMLRWKQHVPNVTNGDFIKKICRFFGLSMYIDPFHREVQLSFVNHVFDAGGIDISAYITNSERMTYNPKKYTIKADTILGIRDAGEDFRMDDVVKRGDLESARSKRRMDVFIANENAYNIAKKNEKTGKFQWETNSGNDHTLTIGENDIKEETVTMDIAVPNMRVVDIDGVQKYICDIATSGNTKLMDDDYNGEFDMVLQQYKGQQLMLTDAAVDYLLTYIEAANPTCYDKDGNVSNDYLTLAATGKNSVGEKWLRKYYEFKSGQEAYRFTARIPVHVFWYIYQTQLPQIAIGPNERRWLIIKNRRYLPLKVSYEIGVNAFITATIECVRMHVE